MAVKKKIGKKQVIKKTGSIVSRKVGNYEKHPFFVKKKTDAKAFLKKAGLPLALVSKSA